MPKLPDASALGQRPGMQTANYNRPSGDISGDALIGAGQQALKIGAEMQADEDRLNIAKAKADYLTKSLEVESQFENDTDHTTLPKRYMEAKQGISGAILGAVPSARARKALEIDFQEELARDQFRIKQRANNLWKDDEIGQATVKSDAMKKAYIQTGDPKYIDGVNDQWNGLKGVGVLTAEQATRKSISDAEEMTKGRLDVMPPEFRAGLKNRIVQPLDRAAGAQSGSAIEQIITKLEDDGTGKVTYDTGGETKYGISKKWNPDIDVKNLTKEQAAQILKERYWDKNNIDSLPENMRLVAFDAVVNQGPRAMEWVKEANGDPEKLLELRRADYARLAKEDPATYGKYAKGWENRLKKLGANVAYDPAGDVFDHLPADYLMQVSRNAEAEIERGHTQLRQDLITRAEDSISMAANGKVDKNPPSLMDFQTAFPKDGEKKYAEYQDQREFATNLNTVQSAPPAFQERILKELEPKPGPNFAREQKQYDDMRQAIATTRKAFKEDPQTYAAQYGIAPEIQPINFSQSQQQVQAGVQQRASTANFLSTQFGVPNRLFTNTEIAAMKEIYQGDDIKATSRMISSIGGALNYQQRISLANELAEKEPMLAVAMTMSPDKAFNLINGDKAKSAVSPEKFRAAADKTLAGVFMEGSKNTAVMDALYAYYKSLSLGREVTGQAETSTPDEDLLNKAIKDVVGEVVTIDPTFAANPSRVVAFKGDDGETISTSRLENMFMAMTDEDMIKQRGELPYAGEDRPSAKDLISKARIVSVGDGQFGFKYPGSFGYVTDATGKPYILDGRKLDRDIRSTPRAKDIQYRMGQ